MIIRNVVKLFNRTMNRSKLKENNIQGKWNSSLYRMI